MNETLIAAVEKQLEKATGSELPPEFWMQLFEKHNLAGGQLAIGLFQQIEEENPQCAFWMVSALAKLQRVCPELVCSQATLSILEEAIPKTVAEYKNYVRDT